MGKANKTRKFAAVKRILNPKDTRIAAGKRHASNIKKQDPKEVSIKKLQKDNPDGIETRIAEKADSSLFFEYNMNLVPPYQILIDTNFINFSIQHKIDVLQGMMNCLYAKCIPCVTDCVVGEIEKMGIKYRLALKLIKDPRFVRLKCCHSGTYADDCLVERVAQHKCYIVATNDKDLKRRIRKIPGIPIMYVADRAYAIERMPDTITAVPTSHRMKL